MTAQEILAEIKPLGRDSYRKVLSNRGVPEPCYGVKVEDLKKSRNARRLSIDSFHSMHDFLHTLTRLGRDKVTPMAFHESGYLSSELPGQRRNSNIRAWGMAYQTAWQRRVNQQESQDIFGRHCCPLPGKSFGGMTLQAGWITRSDSLPK
jgi:hypothetical protein